MARATIFVLSATKRFTEVILIFSKWDKFSFAPFFREVVELMYFSLKHGLQKLKCTLFACRSAKHAKHTHF